MAIIATTYIAATHSSLNVQAGFFSELIISLWNIPATGFLLEMSLKCLLEWYYTKSLTKTIGLQLNLKTICVTSD